MKNTTKTIAVVLAVFLVAALFVGAASAALPDVSRNVANNSTAFVYEKITLTGTSVEPLVLYDGDAKNNVVNSISASEDDGTYYYNLLSDVVGSKYGRYYIGTSDDYIDIWYPEIVVKAELNNNAGKSVVGQTVTKSTDVKFIVQAPKVGPAGNSTYVTVQTAYNKILSTAATPGSYDADGKLTATAKGEIDAELAIIKANTAVYAEPTEMEDTIDGVVVTTTMTATEVATKLKDLTPVVNYDNLNHTAALFPAVQLIFTTPANGKTTMFNDVDFSSLYFGGQVEVSGTATADVAAGTWTVQAEFVSPYSFKTHADKSNTASFTVQSATLTITAAQDSVIRSNPFTVTISGEAETKYRVYIDGASDSDINPQLQPGQIGLEGTISTDGTAAEFKTDASGKRNIQYNTAADTTDKTYTIRVEATDGSGDYDTVKVKVEKGAVTISASGDGSYYIGDEITLSGTNTDSDNVFLFITGPNLNANGINLKKVADKEDAYLATNPVAVKTDDTWEYKWDTSSCGLDTGAYTIYATSVLTNGKASNEIATTSKYGVEIKGVKTAVKLSDSEYATVSVNLKQPFLSAVPSGSVIAQGDKLYVRGTAEGNPSTLQMYIFGPNFFDDYTITVEDDGTYEKKIDIGSDWASNQYFIVIQHPMYNDKFDAKLAVSDDEKTKYFYIEKETTGGQQQGSFVVWGANKLQGSQAADALTKMIDDANIDDIYTKLTFTVAAPWIRIDNPGDQAVGSTFTISGTTNLAADDQVLVEVQSSSFTAMDKTSTSTTSGVSMTTKVVAGEGTDNVWSVEVDTTNWKLDEYTIKVNGIEVDVSTTTNFNLVEKVVVTPTATATGATPTTTATATATTAPTQTPGFGAFLLVLRRN